MTRQMQLHQLPHEVSVGPRNKKKKEETTMQTLHCLDIFCLPVDLNCAGKFRCKHQTNLVKNMSVYLIVRHFTPISDY